MDGHVDGDDYSLWLVNLGQNTTTLGHNPRWIEGNWNGDDRVDGDDYSIWLRGLGKTGMASSDGPRGVTTPEPSTLVLVATAALVWIFRRLRSASRPRF
jgi:hypothetical protein